MDNLNDPTLREEIERKNPGLKFVRVTLTDGRGKTEDVWKLEKEDKDEK